MRSYDKGYFLDTGPSRSYDDRGREVYVDPRIRQIVKKLEAYEPEKIILFGSAARGENDRTSDVDLLIVKRTRKRFLDRLKEVMEILRPNYAIDVLVYTPSEFRRMQREENPFIGQILKDGVVLYEKPSGGSQALA